MTDESLAVRALAPVRRAGQALLRRSRGRWWNRPLVALHDAAGRAVRFVVDPRERPEIGQAAAVFAGTSLPLSGSPRVLIVSQRAWAGQTALESTLAAAFALRRAEVHLVTCGGDLPACEMGRPRVERPSPCRHCVAYQTSFLSQTGLPLWRERSQLAPEDTETIVAAVDRATTLSTFTWEGLDIGRLVRPAVAWTIRDQRIDGAGRDHGIYRDFVIAGAETATAAVRLLDQVRPEIVLALNGTFMEERIIGELARRRGVRVVTYEAGPETNTWFFSDSTPACEYDMSSLWNVVGSEPLSEAEDHALEAVLDRRRRGAASDRAEARRAHGIGGERLVSVFTNVGWDTGAFERGVGYADDLAWLQDVLAVADHERDITFVVRVHPGETPLRPREPLFDIIQRFGVLPPNVRVYGADDVCNSYSLVAASDAVAVYSSTIGMEASAMGVPALVGARTHYRSKGFTWDVESPRDLRAWLASPPVMDRDRHRAARAYAHLFFLRGLLRLPYVAIDGPDVELTYRSIAELEPGHDPVLDGLCHAIVRGPLPLLATGS